MRNAEQEERSVLKTSEPPDECGLPDGARLTLILNRRRIWTAFKRSLVMMRPDLQKKNPFILVVEIGAILTLLCVLRAVFGHSHAESLSYFISLDAWLFLTVISVNFVTALTE